MDIRLSTASPARLRADAWILFVWSDTSDHWPSADPTLRRLSRMVRHWMDTSGFRGQSGEATYFPTWETLPVKSVILVGLGKKKDFNNGRLAKAAASASRKAMKLGLTSIVYLADGFLKSPSLSRESLVKILAQSAHRGAYVLKTAGPRGSRISHLRSATIALGSSQTPSIKAALHDGDIIGSTINTVSDLANLPGNRASPATVASWSSAMAKRHGLTCTVWDEKQLLKNKCEAVLAVGRGSRSKPRMIILKYKGTSPRLRPVVLVGKTITFDTGGISLKPAKSMEWMRYDKSGGMAVLAAMSSIAQLRVRRPIIAVLAAAENMPGGDASRPGDIIGSRAGKSIEVINTDAEGRLVLADALSVAQTFNPRAMVDLATLTGAAITAVGHVVSAVMGSRDSLVAQLREAGEATGDRLWQLPLYPEYADMLSTPFADLKNTGDGTAGAIAGGMFLRQFVSDDVPWAHIDLTNAWEEKEQSHAAAGATLFGAALLCEWISHLDREST